MNLPARLRVWAVALLALPLALTACANTAAEPATETTGSAAAEFAPVTIPHLWGQTEIATRPERVVVLGVTDSDPLLALGVVPVATAAYGFYSESLVGPWATELLQGQKPDYIDAGEIKIEEVAAYDPDLIVAISSGIEEDEYKLLSAIAPTLPRPAGTAAYAVPRDQATLMIAEAVGKKAEGEALVKKTADAFAAITAAHPEFAGKTATVVLPYDGKYGAYTPGDARGAFMADLGFELPAGLAALDDGSSFFLDVSREELTLLEGDVLVAIVDDTARKVVEEDKVLGALDVVTRGDLVIADGDVRAAMTYNSVLSVPYALEALEPELAKALAG